MKVFGEWREFGRCLRRDAERYSELLGWWRAMGFWVGATYRFGRWARTLPLPLKLPALLLHKLVRIPWILFLNVNIPAAARIGPGLCLIHPHNVYIPAGGEIGENFLVFHEVTLGTGPLPRGGRASGTAWTSTWARRSWGASPWGTGPRIGANCVVNRNVAPGSVVVMAPNRVVPASLVEAFGPNRPFAQGMPGTPAAAAREVPGVAGGPAPEPEEPEIAKAR